ncbi:hypothetical protein MMC16_006622 [Acarospora aff. strigata]|nr:hypothetical protein [Acarospora aff. strigata]
MSDKESHTVDTGSSSSTVSSGSPESVRKRAREEVNAPSQRRKHKKVVNEETKEIQAGINSIERKTRWLHLLHFSNRYADDIIKEVYGEDVDPNGQDYNFAENLIKDQTRSYKLMVIKKMLEHVRAVKDNERTTPGGVTQQTDSAVLHEYFLSVFTKETFLQVFYFMDGYLDFDGCSNLGKYYMKNIYANFAVQCKLHDDLVERNDPGRHDSHKDIGDFYQTMSLSKHYDQVDDAQFAELTASAANRIAAKRKKLLLPDSNPRYHVSGNPPSPSE